MSVVAFIEPPQAVVIEKILRHCGLWHDTSARAPRDEPRELTLVAEDAIWTENDRFLDTDAFTPDPADDWYQQPADDEPRELTLVDEDTCWAQF